jgi:hypothetical protein
VVASESNITLNFSLLAVRIHLCALIVSPLIEISMSEYRPDSKREL